MPLLVWRVIGQDHGLEAISQRDYPIITGVALIIGLSVMLINLAVDLSYGLLDPKVRYR